MLIASRPCAAPKGAASTAAAANADQYGREGTATDKHKVLTTKDYNMKDANGNDMPNRSVETIVSLAPALEPNVSLTTQSTTTRQ
jgi:hypothetical protein